MGVIRFVQNLVFVSTVPPEVLYAERNSTLEFELVLVVDAARRRLALSFKLMRVEISPRYSTAFAEALRKDSAM